MKENKQLWRRGSLVRGAGLVARRRGEEVQAQLRGALLRARHGVRRAREGEPVAGARGRGWIGGNEIENEMGYIPNFLTKKYGHFAIVELQKRE